LDEKDSFSIGFVTLGAILAIVVSGFYCFKFNVTVGHKIRYCQPLQLKTNYFLLYLM